ncbi:MAG TPA: hypothetical protein VLZ83_04360 [Edaphocola sp.]|nr:hypothetical protein [Edaphocola sp.]
MKKLKFVAFMMGAVLMSAGFTACSDDDDVIDILVDGEITKEVKVGEEISFKFTVVSDKKIDKIRYLVNSVQFEIEENIKETTFSRTFSYTPEVIGKLNFSIEVTDSKGKVQPRLFQVDVIAAAGEIEIYKAVLLGGNKHLTLGSFYSVSENKVFTIANAKANAANIDFAYYYGAENKATIAATSDAGAIQVFNDPTNGLSTWTTKKDTKFKKTQITAVQFDEIENDAEISILESISNSSVTKLAENDVIAFETEEGKKGLFKITELKANSEGSITIIVKVQK